MSFASRHNKRDLGRGGSGVVGLAVEVGVLDVLAEWWKVQLSVSTVGGCMTVCVYQQKASLGKEEKGHTGEVRFVVKIMGRRRKDEDETKTGVMSVER